MGFFHGYDGNMMDVMGIMRIEWGFHANIMGILNRFKGQSRKPWFLHVFNHLP